MEHKEPYTFSPACLGRGRRPWAACSTSGSKTPSPMRSIWMGTKSGWPSERMWATPTMSACAGRGRDLPGVQAALRPGYRRGVLLHAMFDTVRRYFEYKGYKVKFVSNLRMWTTKSSKRPTKKRRCPYYFRALYCRVQKDMKDMNVEPATVHPQATQEIQGMINMIQTLIDKGHAYVAEDGTVYLRRVPLQNMASCPTKT